MAKKVRAGDSRKQGQVALARKKARQPKTMSSNPFKAIGQAVKAYRATYTAKHNQRVGDAAVREGKVASKVTTMDLLNTPLRQVPKKTSASARRTQARARGKVKHR